jgi:hypothetical protein
MSPGTFTLVTLILTGIGAILGYILRYQFDKKKELTSEVNKERRAVYQQLVDLLYGLLENVKKGKEPDMNELTTKMFGIYRKNVLYASPKVIQAFNEFLDYSQNLKTANSSRPEVVLFKMAGLIAAMRKDLGLSNRGLGKHNKRLLRSAITDIDNY